MSARKIVAATSLLVVAAVTMVGCSAASQGSNAGPTTSVAFVRSEGTPVMSTATGTTSKTSIDTAPASGSAGVPVCGSYVAPFTETTLISTPAADICSVPDGGSASPTCPIQPTEVVQGTETRPPAPGDLLSGSPIAGFGRFGGAGGGSMYFTVYPSDTVFLTNGERGVLLPSSRDPLRIAGRTQLARSDAIWGAASSKVDHLQLQDSARPNGVAVTFSPIGTTQVRVFVAPVSAGSATITAFSQDGTVLQAVKQG